MTVAGQSDKDVLNRRWGALVFVLVLIIIVGGFKQKSGYNGSTVQQQRLFVSPEVQRPAIQERQLNWKQTANLHKLDLDASHFECSKEESVRQSCVFTNIVLYRGQLIYVIPEGSNAKRLKLPDPALFEVNNSPSNHYDTSSLFKVRTQNEVLQQIDAAIKEHSPRRNPLVLEFDHALFGRTRTFRNWFWVVNGAGNFYHRFCKYFGICTSKELQATAILHPQLNSTDLTEVGYVGLPRDLYSAVHDMFSCFGTIFWVNHGENKVMTEKRFEDRIILFKKVLVGVGTDVVHPRTTRKATGEIYYDQASNELAVKRVQYLRQCAGLARIPDFRKRPRVMLVNRPYSDGRSILGLDDVYDRLRRELPADIDVSIMLPRGSMGLRGQAVAFDSSDIVVVPHGAANGNVNFLPYNAVVIAVYALQGRYEHERTLVESLPKPPYNMTIIPVDCSKRTEGWVSGALALPEFKELDPEKALELLNADMSNERADDLESALGMSRLDWMDYKAYRPDPEQLAKTVIEAVRLWESKRLH